VTPYDAAYQGAPGAFSEEAALAVIGRSSRLLACRTFEEVFDAVASGRAARAVVPVENSLAGPVAPVARLLGEREVEVVGEVTIPVVQSLVAAPGATLETVRRVRSHAMALAQCARFFARHPRLEAVEAFDTAGAVAEVVRSGTLDEAAIASRRAALVYGGVVLADSVQDSPDTHTRFLVVERAASTAAHATEARP
jgi:prephenate dehydratase